VGLFGRHFGLIFTDHHVEYLVVKLDWGVCTSLKQLYGGRDMYRVYYIKNSHMFRHFIFAIIRLRNEK